MKTKEVKTEEQENKVKKCNTCKKEKHIDEYIHKTNNTELRTCLLCRENDTLKRKLKKEKDSKNNPSSIDGLKLCSDCNKYSKLIDFISKRNGEPVKTCLGCREKDICRKATVEMKKLTSIRNKEKKYYVKYRETKRQENEEEYLKHNAEIQKKWRVDNQERVTQWRTNNVNYRLKGIKQQAKKKNIEWNETMTNEHCTYLMKRNCYYCDFISNETVNGIDRMDSSKGYHLNNCVSCCKNCNFIKKCLDPVTFINR
jgi:hypothetical protein